MKRHNFFLPDDLVAEMKKLSETTGATMSEIVRRALKAYIAEQVGKVPHE